MAQLAQCSTSWREAMDAWRASTPHVACTSDALRRARGYSDGAVDSEVARDFLLHLSRLYPALQVVECAAHLSLATAHVQRVEARVEVKIATARELTRGCPKLHSLLVPTWSFPAAAVLQRLWLDRNQLGPRGCRALAEAAGQRGCALRELRLGGNARLSTADADALAKLGESDPERASGPLRLKLQIAG